MIQAKELRIGNYLDAAGETEIVTEIYEDYFYTKSCKSTWALIKPIPITKEWLIDFGCQYIDDHEYIIKDDLILENEYTDKGVWNFCTEHSWITEIKYIHQLQNLYFAITGKELIKQKPASNR